MRVKMISGDNQKKFEGEVNDFITQKGIKVIEFHYGVSAFGWSVMIVYEDANTAVYA